MARFKLRNIAKGNIASGIKGAVVGGLIGAGTGFLAGAAAAPLTGGASLPAGVASGAAWGAGSGFVAGYKKDTIKKEVQNFTGVTDQKNEAIRSSNAISSLFSTPKKDIVPIPNKILGQTDTMAASEEEAQRKRLVNQLRAGFASTLNNQNNLLGNNYNYDKRMNNSANKSRLGQ